MEQAVKQRLVGAVVLAALAVITLPLIFDAERSIDVLVPESVPPRPEMPAFVVEEPKPVATLSDNPVPIGDMYRMDSAQPVDDTAPPEASVPITPAATTSPIAKTAVTALPPVPPAPGGKLQANGMAEAWAVQVAAMSDRKKADALIAQLKLNGLPAYSVIGKSEKGETVRVFIGPKLDKAQAVKIKQQVDKEMGLNTMVVPFTPR